MRFRHYIQNNVNVAPAGKPFVLASGKTSGYYVDLRKALLEDASAVEAAARDLLGILPPEVDLIGGVPTAGLLLLSPVLMLAGKSSNGVDRRGFYTRRDGKAHGTGRRVEGNNFTNNIACLLEDTVTTGGSIIEHAAIAREAGINVKYALALLDREEGAAARLHAEGITLLACYKSIDIV